MYSVGDEGATWYWATQCTTPWIHRGSSGLHHWKTSWTAREKIKPPTSIFIFFSVKFFHALSISLLRGDLYACALSRLSDDTYVRVCGCPTSLRRICTERNQPLATTIMIGNKCLQAYIACLLLLVLVSLLYQTYALWISTQKGRQRVLFDREQMCRNINTSGTYNIRYSLYNYYVVGMLYKCYCFEFLYITQMNIYQQQNVLGRSSGGWGGEG